MKLATLSIVFFKKKKKTQETAESTITAWTEKRTNEFDLAMAVADSSTAKIITVKYL